MEWLEYIAKVLAVAGALAAVLVAGDQLTQGARDRRLELFIRESSGEDDPGPVLNSLRRTLVARTVARDAVPLRRCILPVVALGATWTFLAFSMRQDEMSTSLMIMGVPTLSVISIVPVLRLGFWRHERARALESLERGDGVVRVYDGLLAIPYRTLPGRGWLALSGFSFSASLGLFSAVQAIQISKYWIFVSMLFFVASSFSFIRYAMLEFPKFGRQMREDAVEPSWEHPRPLL